MNGPPTARTCKGCGKPRRCIPFWMDGKQDYWHLGCFRAARAVVNAKPRPYAVSRPAPHAWVKATRWTRELALHRLLVVSLENVSGNKDAHLNYSDATADIRWEDLCINPD